MKRYKILFTFVPMTVLLLSFSFIACGTETTKPPVNDDPIVVTDDCRETKTFAFDPRYSGKYIFFGNTRYYDITVKEYAEELVPTVNGEYRISGGGKYSVSFDGCEEDEYTLTYDVSDDREFTLAPGEEYLVKLGRIWDEVRTLETGNGNIRISGVYKGSADDLDRADLYGRITDPVSSYTMAWRYDDGDYYATVVNTGDGEETAALSFSDIPHVTVGADGSAETIVDFDGEHYSYICFEDVPAGNYVMTVENGLGGQFDVLNDSMDRLSTVCSSGLVAFSINEESDVYIGAGMSVSEQYKCKLNKEDVSYIWLIDGEPIKSNKIFIEQGDSIKITLEVDGQKYTGLIQTSGHADYSVEVMIGSGECIVSLDENSLVNGGGFGIIAGNDTGLYMYPMLTVIPTLAEPFSGLSGIVADAGKVTMQWQNVPNLYSFEYKLNGVLQPELLVDGETSYDITSTLSDNADRAIIEITEITYSYPVYGDDGNPTGETKKVSYPASEDMVYIVDL